MNARVGRACAPKTCKCLRGLSRQVDVINRCACWTRLGAGQAAWSGVLRHGSAKVRNERPWRRFSTVFAWGPEGRGCQGCRLGDLSFVSRSFGRDRRRVSQVEQKNASATWVAGPFGSKMGLRLEARRPFRHPGEKASWQRWIEHGLQQRCDGLLLGPP